jgi:hypothetical protein
VSNGNVNQQGGLPDDFWDYEDKRQAEFEHIVQANKLGGHSDEYADLDTTDEDDESEDTNDDGDASRPDEDSKRKDLPPQ